MTEMVMLEIANRTAFVGRTGAGCSARRKEMSRETLSGTILVVSDEDGNEIEVDMDSMIGNLNEEASQSLAIGRAVRAALMGTAHDGAQVTVMVYAQ